MRRSESASRASVRHTDAFFWEKSTTSIQRPLVRHRVMLSRRIIAYYGLIRASESLSATYGFAAGSAAPKENRLEVGIQRFPNLLRWTGLACRLPYPGGPEECK